MIRPNSVLLDAPTQSDRTWLGSSEAPFAADGGSAPRPSDRKLPAHARRLHLQCWGESAVFLQNPCSGHMCGAGGNRTPVHQSVNGPATTIPDLEPDASSLAGQLPVTSGGPRIVFPNCQRSFSPSVVFPTVIPHFCCRAVMDWPRAASLLTMSVVSPEDQAARVNCSLAILWVAPFNESEQLGSQTRPSDLTSKPVSPLNGMYVKG